MVSWNYDELLYYWETVIPGLFDDSDPPQRISTWGNAMNSMISKFGEEYRCYTERIMGMYDWSYFIV